MAVSIELTASAHLDPAEVADKLGTPITGLTETEATQRLAQFGPNSLPSHHASAAKVLGGQVKNPILVLLAVACALSLVTGDRADASIILIILSASVGIGFWNEYRAQLTADALQAGISHFAVVVRDGAQRKIPVHVLVPGDLVHISLGNIVPADLRLLESSNLSCDEAAITGESVAADKNPGSPSNRSTMTPAPPRRWSRGRTDRSRRS